MPTTNPGSITESEHATTPAIWAATATIAVGSVVGGIALIEWMWPLFWTGVGLMVIGAFAAGRVGIMNSVSEWSPPPSRRRTSKGGAS